MRRTILVVLVALLVSYGLVFASPAKKASSAQGQIVAAVKAWQKSHGEASLAASERFGFFKQAGDWAKISTIQLDARGQEVGEYYNYLLKRKAGRWQIVKGFNEGLDPVDCRRLGLSAKTAKDLCAVVVDYGKAPGEAIEGAPMPKFKVPHEAAHFRILWVAEDAGKYEIVPKIPFGGPRDQPPQYYLKKYWAQYVRYGREALDWMRTKGVKPTDENITWWAEEWWPKGAKIPLEGSAKKARPSHHHR